MALRMAEQVISGLVIVTGVISTAVGIAAAAGRLRAAGRAYRKTETLYAAMPEGWNSWFLGGFSGLTMGTHLLWAIVVLASWTLAGACLITLGLLLFWRA